MEIPLDAARAVLGPWHDSRPTFAREGFPDPPREGQGRALAMLDESPRGCFIGGRGVGKTVTEVIVALHWITTRPESLVVVVFPTREEAKIFWNTFRRVYGSSVVRKLWPGADVQKDCFVDREGALRIVSVSSESPAQEGWHAAAVLVIFDEAKGVDDETYRVTRGYLSGAAETSQFAASTAGPPRGWFYRWATEGPTIRVSAHEEAATRAMAEEAEREFGSDDPFYRQQYRAEFVDEGLVGDTLLSLALLERCVGIAAPVPPGHVPIVRCLGVDPSSARSGRDEFTVAIRIGGEIQRVAVIEAESSIRAAEKVLDLAAETECWDVVVDRGGLGVAIADYLEGMAADDRLWGGRLRIHEFVSQAAAEDRERFASLKAQTLYRLRGQLGRDEVSLPSDRVLLAQLASYTVKTDPKGRLALVDPPKSPDRGDAVICALAFDALVRSDAGGADLVLPDGRVWA